LRPGPAVFAAGLVPIPESLVNPRLILLALLLLTFLFGCGCGGGRDRGKHQDFDRPKATEKK
jgi:hypothetical protein